MPLVLLKKAAALALGNLAIEDKRLSPDYIDHNRSDRLGRPSMPLLWSDWSQGNFPGLPRPT